MLIFYILISLVLGIALLDNTKLSSNSKAYLLYAMAFVLVLFAGLRGQSVDRDYINYQEFFALIPEIQYFFLDPSTYFEAVSIEPSFMLIASVIKAFFYNGLPLVIFLYALFSVFLKVKVMIKISDYPLLSFLLYFTTVFFLQDMTQIRVGIALCFAFLSIIAIEERQLVKFSVYILLGVFFHYSIIFFAPFYFIDRKNINKTLYVLVIVVPVFLYFTGFNPLEFLLLFDLGIFTNKLQAYVEMQKWLKEDMNMFNFNILFQIILSVLFVFKAEKSKNEYAIILTKIFAVGIAVFYIFSFSPIIAFRSSELLTSVQIFLLPIIISTFKHKALGEVLVIMFALLHFSNQIIINNIFKPYYTIFSIG